MTAPVGLSAALRRKLAALARRIRLLRALRGLAWLVLVVALPLPVAFLTDRWLNLPDEVLSVVLAGLAAATVLVLALGVALPLGRRLSPAALAALVEKHYPHLGERLTSSVELAGCQGAGHGSGALIKLLLEETDRAARPLAFSRSFPARPTARLLGAAGLALLCAAVPAVAWAEDYADFRRRLLTAWTAPQPFVLDVSPGDQAVAVGRPLTVSVQIKRRDSRAAWPESCYLVHADDQGGADRVPMRHEGPGVYRFTIGQVQSSLRYHVECGRVASETFRVTAVEPVALAPGGLVCVLTPPPYVNPVFHPAQTLRDFSELSALQYSRVHLHFRFHRPAQAARLSLTPNGRRVGSTGTTTLPVALSADSTRGAVEVTTASVGSYSLRLDTEAELGITSRHDLPPLAVWADEPPAFAGRPRVEGLSDADAVASRSAGPAARAKVAAPSDSLSLHVSVQDRVGVDRAEVEYRVNGRPAVVERIFEAKGAPGAAAEHRFRLAGKVNDGDRVLFRIRAADNRRLARGAYQHAAGRAVPEQDLAPHVIYYPDQDRWFALRIDSRAEPLRSQGILADREEVNRRLQAIRKRVRDERTRLEKLRTSSKGRPGLDRQQAQELNAAQRENSGVIGDLSNLAREAARTPALAPAAEGARSIARGEMTRTGEAVQRVREARADAAARDRQLRQADSELAAAVKRLEALQRLNDRLAQDRLDQAKLDQLAQREADLGRRATALAADRAPDKKPADLAALRAEQAKVFDELRRLAEQSKLLREALGATQADEARRLAARARELARGARELAQAEARSRKEQLEKLMEGFARQQQELAEQASRLDDRVTGPASAARAAAEALKQGQPGRALGLQEQAAAELERAAGDRERALALARDPREAARRLAQAQQALEERLLAEAAKVAVKSARELLKDLDDLRRDQEALKRTVDGLPASPSDRAALQMRQQAAGHAEAAARALAQRDPFQAHEEMQQARQALGRLAALPPAAQAEAAAQRPPDRRARDGAKNLRRLAQAQRRLQEALRQAMADPDKAAGPTSDKARQELARRQEDLARGADALQKGLRQVAESPASPPLSRQAAEQAAAAAGEANRVSKQAAKGQGHERTAQMLDRAAQRADQAAAGMGRPPSSGAGRKAGQALREGQRQAEQGQARLRQGDAKGAGGAMQQAAQALGEAARQAGQVMGQQGRGTGPPSGGTRPATGGTAMPGGTPGPAVVGKDARRAPDRPWGQLPGELRTRLLQDLRARFGDDYAGIIQHYFEGIADTRK
jgi:hypothetical protein